MRCHCIDVSPRLDAHCKSSYAGDRNELISISSLTGREIGYPHRIFDLLDERALNKDEIREFCELLFGNEHFVSAPDVHADWNGFCHALTAALENESLRWNPLKNKLMPWIDVAHLKRAFRGGFWGMLKRTASQNKNSVLRSGIRRKGSF